MKEPLENNVPICSCCGEKGGLMEKDSDGNYTCISCLIMQDDSSIIDRDFGDN